LEKANSLGDDDEGNDDDLQEFSHDDFILAMKMLGKDVPVSDERIAQVRMQAPRSRPAFLNTPAPTAAEPVAEGGYNPRSTEVHRIFREFRHGMRKENAEKEFCIEYPGVQDAFQYWDMRLPEDDKHQGACTLNEVCFELFFFGEFTMVTDHSKFFALTRRMLEVKAGVNARTPLPMREAGCMYPLIAVPVVMTEMEGMNLGLLLFDDFGTALPSGRVSDDSGVAGKPSACGQQ
jgi:hypothetical protein